ncbi:hypothetical protein M406DRAFT_338785 [Cryphonectria parasitica EP155]|uniref:Aminotransferase class V domain-containing protein n=1 Tax=Cryphonectria parasitica (strain ATCC 38755 / EP155) TaxID=660469 RepID=A0A9P4Y1I6_CRYP1|nr:uncharacterized protein M406DRAFT_338785 [Cryphonectria parasitica EP155]KAF3765294.1 hypothetical protein M406DRAFT_338785 [Cryphonectria parasitica EP155]
MAVDPIDSASSSTTNVSLLTAKFFYYRRLVPLVSQPDVVYLNSSFAPPSNLIVHEALAKYSHESLHDPHPKPGWQAAAEDARVLLAKYINATPSSIAFTRDTTEALGNFIRSVSFQPGDNVVILDTEHPNHAYGWMALRGAGLEVRQVLTADEALRTGRVTAATAETFAPFVDKRTRAIGLSSIMFHSGQKNDVASICAAFRPRGIHVLADLTQQVGFAAVDVQALGVSAAAFSLHKGLHCPTGIACMYVDADVLKALDPVPPVVGYGAVSNARSDLLVPNDPIVFHPSAKRFEHLNLCLIGTSAAKAYLSFYLDYLDPSDVEEYLYSLGDKLRIECKKLGIRIVGPSDREGHAPHLYVLDLLDGAWALHLNGCGIHVTAYRLGVRVSLGFYNNVIDIERLAGALKMGLDKGIPMS